MVKRHASPAPEAGQRHRPGLGPRLHEAAVTLLSLTLSAAASVAAGLLLGATLEDDAVRGLWAAAAVCDPLTDPFLPESPR